MNLFSSKQRVILLSLRIIRKNTGYSFQDSVHLCEIRGTTRTFGNTKKLIVFEKVFL